MSAFLKKVLHALAPAAGAAVGAVGDAIAGGGASARTVVCGAIGAFVAYFLKPARPADPPAGND